MTSSKPASCARPSSRGPMRASWPLREVTAKYSSSQRSSSGVARRPGEGPVVGVAGGQHAVGPQHPAQLDQGGHRVGEVLEHLVQVDHVEGGVGVPEGEEVADLEPQVLEAEPGGVLLRLGHDVGGRVDPDHLARRHQEGQVGGDGPGPAAHVEQRLPGTQVGEEVGGGVLGRPPGVAAQDRFVVPVRVGHAYIVACPNCPRCRRCPSASTRCLAGLTLRRADLLGFSSLKTYDPSPDSLKGRRLLSVGRRAKYLVWEFEGGTRIVLHLSQAGRVDVEDPPKKTKPRGSVARFVFGSGDAGLDGPGVAVLVREHGTQRKASWWVLAPGRRGPAGRPRPRAGQRGVRRLHPHQRLPAAPHHRPARPARRLGHRARAGATTSCTGPSSRPSPRCARSPASNARPCSPRRPRCWPRRSSWSGGVRVASRRPSSAGGSRCTAALGEPCPTPCGDTLRRVSFESYEMAYCPTCQTGGKVLADRRLSRLLK